MGNLESTDLGQGNSTSLFFVLWIVCTAPNNRNTPVNVRVRRHKPLPVCITGSNSNDLRTPIARIPKSSWSKTNPMLLQRVLYWVRVLWFWKITALFQGNWNVHIIPAPEDLKTALPSSKHNKPASLSQIVYQVSDIKRSSFSRLILWHSMRKSASN